MIISFNSAYIFIIRRIFHYMFSLAREKSSSIVEYDKHVLFCESTVLSFRTYFYDITDFAIHNSLQLYALMSHCQ